MSNLIKFKGEYFKIIKIGTKANSCIGCHWQNNLQIQCPSEANIWECDGLKAKEKNNFRGEILIKQTLNEVLEKL